MRKFSLAKRLSSICLFTIVSAVFLAAGVQASTLVPQTWLPGDTLYPAIAFTQTLPVFGPGYNATLPRVNAKLHPFLKVTMKEITQQVLPPPYPPTSVWAYEISNALTGQVLGPAHWPAVTVQARKGLPTAGRPIGCHLLT